MSSKLHPPLDERKAANVIKRVREVTRKRGEIGWVEAERMLSGAKQVYRRNVNVIWGSESQQYL